eukprot:2786847-Rhodomonas_salina.2
MDENDEPHGGIASGNVSTASINGGYRAMMGVIVPDRAINGGRPGGHDDAHRAITHHLRAAKARITSHADAAAAAAAAQQIADDRRREERRGGRGEQRRKKGRGGEEGRAEQRRTEEEEERNGEKGSRAKRRV